MVAAARLRKAQENVLATRPYVAGLQAVIEKLSSSTESQNVFMKEVENPQNVLLIVIGSDRGLCGGFNSNLFRFVTDSLKERFPGFKENGKLSVITIGRKAGDFFGKRDFKVVMKNNGFFDNLRFDRSAEISAEVAAAFKSGEYDSVYIAFNEFKSVIAQNRIFTKLLPVSVDKTEEDSFDNIDYIFEPNPAQILDNIIPLHINMQLWRALLESNASEQGARMAAMDNATENAKEIIGHLNLSYNKARQAAITTELSEIVSGAEALNG